MEKNKKNLFRDSSDPDYPSCSSSQLNGNTIQIPGRGI